MLDHQSIFIILKGNLNCKHSFASWIKFSRYVDAEFEIGKVSLTLTLSYKSSSHDFFPQLLTLPCSFFMSLQCHELLPWYSLCHELLLWPRIMLKTLPWHSAVPQTLAVNCNNVKKMYAKHKNFLTIIRFRTGRCECQLFKKFTKIVHKMLWMCNIL